MLQQSVYTCNKKAGIRNTIPLGGSSFKPRLHQIHVAGYKYPGRASCIRLHVDGYMSPDTSSKQCSTQGYKWIHAAVRTILSLIQDTCISGLHVSGVNAALDSHRRSRCCMA